MAQYILPVARNLTTGQVVQEHDLAGRRFSPHERAECQRLADRLAQQMSDRGQDQWQGFCKTYHSR